MVKRYSKLTIFLSAVLSFVIGFMMSAFAIFYLAIPDSSVIAETQKLNNDHSHIFGENLNVETIKSQDLSIHFLELGNKYTGDCTLIKVGDVEILIDAGSRANSVPVIKEYLDQYVNDNKIEFVIVTHAHQDHIAGFGTSQKTESLFDLYNIENVIQFVYTSSTAQVYRNYLRELDELKERCGTNVYNALQCVNETDGAQKIYDLNPEIKLEILDQKYYHEDTATSENDNSVCCQIIQNDERYYLFTGDLEEKGEASLVELNRISLHQVELYKAGHHGSKTSSTNTLLEIIKPKTVCVCCCAGSSEYTKISENQFPTQNFIDRVAPYTNNVFVTTLCLDYKAGTFVSMNGNIVIYCKRDDEVITVACSNNVTPLKDTDWFKTNRKCPKNWATAK